MTIEQLIQAIFGLLLIVFSLCVFTFISWLVFCVWLKQTLFSLYKPKKVGFKATRHTKNPILSPDPLSEWEQIGTFNPAAYLGADGTVHLLYRAIGADGVSRVGYANTKDGLTIDEKSTYSVFSMQRPSRPGKFDPVMYPSGGSWGGAEDPRIVEIGDKLYMTFNAFDGWDFIRIGVTWITKKDFLANRWNWSKPILISPAGQINKNWVLFPEKINGKFAILHSITPKIQIDYVDQLESLASGSRVIKSVHKQIDNREDWDTWVRGAGPPPIKTEAGWLVLYHAISKEHPDRYQLGAMLLDKDDLTHIIARSPTSILMPDIWYENDWKPGVVYACGAVVKNDLLYIYYGGGDKHVCVAHTPMDTFLKWLTEHGKVN